MNAKSVTVKLGLILSTLVVLAYAHCAEARVTCTPSAPTFSAAYPSINGTLTIVAGSFTVTCSKSRGGTATATYQVAASLGNNAVGSLRYATFGANTLNYDLTSDAGCASTWNDTTAFLPVPPTLTPYTTPSLTRGASDVHTFLFWGCVPANQAAPVAGNYTDSVTLSLVNASTTDPQGIRLRTRNMSVTIVVSSNCGITSLPSPMTFNYTSGQGTAATAASSYTVTCTNALPYTMSLDTGGTGYTGTWSSPTGSYANTASTLTYTLTLHDVANNIDTGTGTGTGAAQNFTINGSMPAGQGGTCATLGGCTFSDVHTLTVTY